MINVLVACECSQVYLSEFMKYPSFNPVSCDVLKTDGRFPDRHIVCDVLQILDGCNCFSQSGIPISVPAWDIVVAFPPCTYLTNAGARWFNIDRYGDEALNRLSEREKAVSFVERLWNSCDNVMIENPRGYLSHVLGKPNFEGHPWWFGDNARKRTCLWFKGSRMPRFVSPHCSCVDPGLSAPTYIGADGYLKRRSFVLDNCDPAVRSRSFPRFASKVVATIVDCYLSRGAI